MHWLAEEIKFYFPLKLLRYHQGIQLMSLQHNWDVAFLSNIKNTFITADFFVVIISFYLHLSTEVSDPISANPLPLYLLVYMAVTSLETGMLSIFLGKFVE